MPTAPTFTFSRIRLALALLPCLLAGAAQAAERDDAIQRALGHIGANAQRTQHAANHSYAVSDVTLDADGASHVRMKRYVDGLRVIGGDLVVHANRTGGFVNASHTLTREVRVAGRGRIGSADALRAAMTLNARHTPVGSEQVIYARGDTPQLAFDVKLHGTQLDGTPSELHMIISAETGRVLEQWDDIHTAPAAGTGKGFFSGTVALTTDSLTTGFALRDPSRGSQYTVNMANKTSGAGTVFTDADNTWGNLALTDAASVGVDAQYGTAKTWDYFKNVHGRNGIANDGRGAYNRVHYGRKYNNAFWSDTCFCMTYGDGDGVTFNPFDSLDVAGHEMTHGVTSRTANLTYSGESGGLNEGTSDIFGTMVEFYAANANDTPDYLIGERLYKTAGKALRSMIKPSSDGVSADCWYSTVGSLDVHYSSGVANHFYYLLAEGTTNGSPSPTCVAGNTRVATGTGTVAGIGRAKAEKIWYRALTVYMTSSTNYAGARTATLNAAGDLYGAGSLEQQAVAAAWSAVGRN